MTRRRFRPIVALFALGSLLASCGGGSGGGTPPVGNNTPTPSPAPTGYSEAAFQCPSSDTTLAHAGLPSGASGDTAIRRLPNRRAHGSVSNNLLVVSYATGVSTSHAL